MVARFLKAVVLAAFFISVATSAWAQGSILQSGLPVNGHAPVYVGLGTQAVVGDSGTAAGGVLGLGFSEFLLQMRGSGNPPFANAGNGPDATNFCDYDGPTANGSPYHYLCFSPNALSGALIETGAANGATAQPLLFKINGTTYSFPAALSGVVGPASSTVNDLACWNNISGTLLKDCGTAPGTVTSVGLTAPTGFTVTGSPVTGAGTLALTLNSESPSFFLASPNNTSGVPFFRAFTLADLGTQSANTFPAGPTTGSAANPTWRTLVGADLPTPSSSTLGGIQSATTVTHQWIDSISTGGVPHQSQPSYSDLSGSPTPTALAGAASGFVNKLRGTTLTQWYGGTSITVGTSLTWTAEGVGCLETGATVTASQLANPLTSPLSFYSLKLLGQTGNTDLKCRFVIESYDAAALAGQTVTFQIPIQNKTGGSVTPTIATKYPTAQDNWGASTADLATSNLQTCSNNATCTLAYTFNVNAGASNGYEVIIDFGAVGNTAFVVIGGGFDLRATPGVSTGLNSAPPSPELYTVERDTIWSQRLYESTYNNTVAPATATLNGSVIFPIWGGTNSAYAFPVQYKVPKRCAAPTVTLYSGTTGASGKVDNNASADVSASVIDSGNGGFVISTSAFTPAAVGGAVDVQVTSDCRIAGG